MPKIAILSILSLFLFSCVAASSVNVTQEDRLTQEHAVLVTHTRGQDLELVGQILVHNDGDAIGFPWGKIPILKGEDKLVMIKIKPSKTLYLSSYASFGGKAYFGKGAFPIVLEPGSVTYIGDIQIFENHGSIRLRIMDNELQTMAKVRQQAPWLLEKLSYKKYFVGRKH